MKSLATMLLAAALLACTAPLGWSEPNAKQSIPDKLAAANAEEEKGDLNRAHKDYWGALGHYLAAARVNRQDALLYNKLGICELKLNSRKDARKYFSLALKYDPHNASVLNNLGAVAYMDKKYKAAANYFKQALALNELSASTHLNLAEAWLGMGEVDRAMVEYTRALELDADILTSRTDGVQAQIATPEQRARVSYLLAKAYAKRGNADGALEYLGRAKEGHYPDLAKVYTDPEFALLWKDPRLAKIVKR
ncbi:MAG: tetratricopeptide repeat protein [Terracidiphilus sp.]|nr:tetratricopeptide repeat protein [Terracidiphilus sp.]